MCYKPGLCGVWNWRELNGLVDSLIGYIQCVFDTSQLVVTSASMTTRISAFFPGEFSSLLTVSQLVVLLCNDGLTRSEIAGVMPTWQSVLST